MGLDNGIIARKVNKKDIPTFVKDGYADYKDDVMEVAYWRKCWGIREAMANVGHPEDLDIFDFKIEKEDIPAIVRELYRFLDKSYYEENADSIWEFDEIIDNLFQQIINLKWLEGYMEDHPDVEVEFYDSY